MSELGVMNVMRFLLNEPELLPFLFALSCMANHKINTKRGGVSILD